MVFSSTPVSSTNKNWSPRYNWNIVESGIKHYKTNQSNKYNISYVTFLLSIDSLSKSGAQGNWEVLDDHNPNHKMKYYINVCRPVIEVPIGKGCATFAAACRSKFDTNGQVKYLNYLQYI